MVMKRILRFWGVFFVVFPWFFSSPAAAKNKAEIVNIRMGQDGPNLNVSFHIQNCFTPKMDEAIWSGVPTTFRIFVVLERAGHPFSDRKLLNITLEHTIKYDHLREEFRVFLSEQSGKTLATRRLTEAKYWMSHVEDLSLIPLWRLQKDQEYRLTIKAELSKVRLPLFFRYIFFFVSMWDFETGWHTIDFTL